MKIDLSKFKHLKSDDKHATLQHPAGHTITIAISALEPEHQTALKAMAEGGISTQGKDVRHAKKAKHRGHKNDHDQAMDYAKSEAKGRAQFEREAVKPNIKGLAKGGSVNNSADFEFKQYQSENADKFHAYDNGLPCINPHCKSRGIPHPNCKCYSGGGEKFAEGGSVEASMHYCHSKLPHVKGCPHYAEGGNVDPTTGQPDNSQRAIRDQDKAQRVQDSVHKDPPSFSDAADNIKNGLMEVFKAEGGNVKKPEQSLNYDEIRRRKKEMNRQEASKSVKGVKHYAEGDEVQAPSSLRDDSEMPDLMAVPENVMPNLPASPSFQSKQLANQILEMEPTKTPEQAQEQADGIVNRQYQKQNPSLPPRQDSQPAYQPQPEEVLQEQPMAQVQEQPQEAMPIPQPRQAPSAGYSSTMVNEKPETSANPMERLEQQQRQHVANYAKEKTEANLKLVQEDKDWQQDLANGHVSPKTYGDLFHSKSTPGKIGTLFGLLIAGAGAGLTHQPNAVLEMMNKELERDLQAQEKSKENARNFYQLAQNHVLAQSNAKHVDMQTKVESQALAQIYANRAAMHDLTLRVKALPEGSPQRQQADAMLGMMAQQLDSKIYNISDIAAANMAKARMFSNPNGQGENQFQNRQSALRNMGQEGVARADYENTRHVPGINGLASRDIRTDERDRLQSMQILDDKVKDVLDFAHQHRGSINPQVVARAKQKAHELASFYNKSVDTLGITPGRLDWLEKQIPKNPSSAFQQILGSNSALREIRDSNTKRRDLMLYGPGGLGFPAPKTESQTIERRDPTTGKIIIYDAKTKQPLRYK